MANQKRAPTERDRQREETHRRLYDTALGIYRRDGIESASIEEIANRAGVSRGTFYFHFSSKDEVLLELMEESEEALCERVAAMPDDAPLQDVIDAVADDMAEVWGDEPQLLSDLGIVVMRTAAKGIQEVRQSHPVRGELIPRFQRAMKSGEIASLLPAELTVDFFLVNLFGAAVAWVATPVMPLDQVLETVARFFLKATRPD